jgi:hypothetical protein
MRFVGKRRRDLCIRGTVLHERLPVRYGLISDVCRRNEGVPLSHLMVQFGSHTEVRPSTDKGHGLLAC